MSPGIVQSRESTVSNRYVFSRALAIVALRAEVFDDAESEPVLKNEAIKSDEETILR